MPDQPTTNVTKEALDGQIGALDLYGAKLVSFGSHPKALTPLTARRSSAHWRRCVGSMAGHEAPLPGADQQARHPAHHGLPDRLRRHTGDHDHIAVAADAVTIVNYSTTQRVITAHAYSNGAAMTEDSSAIDPRGSLVAEHWFGTVSMLVYQATVEVFADSDHTEADWKLARVGLTKLGIGDPGEPIHRMDDVRVWEIKY
jgi:hypothetical protein